MGARAHHRLERALAQGAWQVSAKRHDVAVDSRGVRDLQAGGPYREVSLVAEPRPPKGFQVREADDELVIERRRRWGVKPLVNTALIGGGLGTAVALFGLNGLLLTLFALMIAGMFGTTEDLPENGPWYRTTLTLSDQWCTLEQRNWFQTRLLQGPPSSLDVVGVFRTDENPRERRNGTHAIELALGGQFAMAFGGAPVEQLEWVVARVARWRLAGGAETRS